MFNITSKYFVFLNNRPPTSWVANKARDLHVIPVRIIVPCTDQEVVFSVSVETK